MQIKNKFFFNLKRKKACKPTYPSYKKIMAAIKNADKTNNSMRIEFNNAIIRCKIRKKLESNGYLVFYSPNLYDEPYFSVRWDFHSFRDIGNGKTQLYSEEED